MHDAITLTRTSTVNRYLPRLLTVLALAVALLAIPAFSPGEASARRMSERTVSRLCRNASGSVNYDFDTNGDWSMTCTLPSGTSFTCTPTGGPFGGIVDC